MWTNPQDAFLSVRTNRRWIAYHYINTHIHAKTLQADLGDTAGSAPDCSEKANITKKRATLFFFFFDFLVHIKVMFTL